MEIIGLFILAVIPGVLLAWFFKYKDSIQPEPWSIVLSSFFLGALVIVPVAFFESWITSEDHDGSLIQVAFEAFILIALTEEFAKYLIIRFYAARKKDFNEVFDGLVYGAAVASGFATLENLFYVYENGFVVGIIRAVLTIPMHIFCGALIGYWLARRRFTQAPLLLALFGGIISATFAHGLFDFVLFYDNASLKAVTLLVVAGLALAMWPAIRYSLRMSKPLTQAVNMEVPETAIEAASNQNSSNLHIYHMFKIGLYFLGVIFIMIGLFFILGLIGLWLDNELEPNGLVAILMIIGICFSSALGSFFWGHRQNKKIHLIQ